jgi:hypothetical protein
MKKSRDERRSERLERAIKIRKENYEKKFWCVKKVVSADGRTEVKMFSQSHEEKPENTSLSRLEKETSLRWFSSREEAEAFYEQVNNHHQRWWLVGRPLKGAIS